MAESTEAARATATAYKVAHLRNLRREASRIVEVAKLWPQSLQGLSNPVLRGWDQQTLAVLRRSWLQDSDPDGLAGGQTTQDGRS